MTDSYGRTEAPGGENGTVVVGLDDSPSADAALDLAAAEAGVRGLALRIVHAHRFRAAAPSAGSREVLDRALERVGRDFPDLPLQHTLVGGGAGEVLVDESGRALLLVLGGLDGSRLKEVTELMPGGSVLAHVVSRAHCPVIITGAGLPVPVADDPVRVAMDGTSPSFNAMRFGCDWAMRQGARVEAVHVVAPEEFDAPAPELELRTPAEARLDGWVTTAGREYPEVDIQPRLVAHLEPAVALARASHGARVLAVGAPHRSAVPRLTAGSVVPDLIRKAACPVAVVRVWLPD